MLVLALALLAAPEIDPQFCDPQDPRHCAVGLQEGQKAPFTGQLLSNDLAVQLGLKADGCDARLAVEVDFAKRTAQVETDLAKHLHEIDRDACKATTTVLHDRLRQAMEAQPFYERPWFVATVTAVLTVGAGSLAIWGAGQLR